MSIESQLREKLGKIETLFAGAGGAGERLAEAALGARRLIELGDLDPTSGCGTCFSLCAGVTVFSPIVCLYWQRRNAVSSRDVTARRRY